MGTLSELNIYGINQIMLLFRWAMASKQSWLCTFWRYWWWFLYFFPFWKKKDLVCSSSLSCQQPNYHLIVVCIVMFLYFFFLGMFPMRSVKLFTSFGCSLYSRVIMFLCFLSIRGCSLSDNGLMTQKSKKVPNTTILHTMYQITRRSLVIK